MAHALPSDPALREAFDVSDLVAMATGERPFVTLREALTSARLTFASSKRGLIHSIFSIVMEADDRVSLIEVGPRGGWKRRHTFGYGRTGS